MATKLLGAKGAKGNYDINMLIENSVMIDRDIIVGLYTGFEKVLRFAGGLLYNASKQAGKLISQRLLERGILSQNNAFDLLLWSFTAGGYAEKVRVANIVKKKNSTIVELHLEGTLLGSRLKGRKRTVDHPLAGYLAGWLETVYEAKIDVRETKCVAKGDPYCVFEIKIHKPIDPDVEVGDVYEHFKEA